MTFPSSRPAPHSGQAPRSQPQPGHRYDVAVIGAGLAGSELALRLAQAGQDVLLVTQALDHVGNLYAPTLAGADLPQSSRLGQLAADLPEDADSWTFHRRLKTLLESTDGLHLLQSTITALDEEEEDGPDGAGSLIRLSSWEGPALTAHRAVLAVGAFLKGRLLVGDTLEDAGRLSEVAYDFLADDLARSGVYLTGAAQEAAAVEGAPPYEVRFLTLADSELDGFRVERFSGVYALGRCTAQGDSYRRVLKDAAQLAAELTGQPGRASAGESA
ncbi:FAD-dependent oxidoreductase [Deinococcus sp. Marseille-Q6407]|uniref:FAD-dependent oxidoreductase n=1 Tax=Deinococcus sp. Marseille-Q6407 TaxID=2969223 RepID=UPI0021BF88E9|nr:FAD-dependent oxidoreductase [Deinococcus sp. Marseille-Q6407]